MPLNLIAALRADVTAYAADGRINPTTANNLNAKLDAATAALNNGDFGEAIHIPGGEEEMKTAAIDYTQLPSTASLRQHGFLFMYGCLAEKEIDIFLFLAYDV